MKNNQTAEGPFLSRLETLRGVAALWVAVGHSLIWLRFETEAAIWAKTAFEVQGIQAGITRWLLSVFSGAAAVDIFFVLSGFVLAQSLSRADLTVANWSRFAIRRVFRIMPAFWLMLALVLLYLTWLYPGYTLHARASAWFSNWYASPLTSFEVLCNVLLASPSMNPNAWTLKVEMLASLVLPFMVYGVSKAGPLGCVATVAAVLLISVHGYTEGLAWYYYLYMFLAGVLAQKHAGALGTKLLTCGSGPAILVPLGICFAASASFNLLHAPLADAIIVGASVLLIAALSQPGIHSAMFFDWRWLRHLGQISYSFYLMHFLVLYGFAELVLRAAPQHVLARYPLPVIGVMAVASVLATLPIAWLSYVFIEKPGVLLAKRVLSQPPAHFVDPIQ